MPLPDDIDLPFDGHTNRLIQDELSYCRPIMVSEHDFLYNSLTPEQKEVFKTIVDAVYLCKGGVFFYMDTSALGKHLFGKHFLLAYRVRERLCVMLHQVVLLRYYLVEEGLPIQGLRYLLMSTRIPFVILLQTVGWQI